MLFHSRWQFSCCIQNRARFFFFIDKNFSYFIFVVIALSFRITLCQCGKNVLCTFFFLSIKTKNSIDCWYRPKIFYPLEMNSTFNALQNFPNKISTKIKCFRNFWKMFGCGEYYWFLFIYHFSKICLWWL